MIPSRDDCAGLDRRDPLKGIRVRFRRPKDLLYFDGNSLGMLSEPALKRAMAMIEEEWGEGLIESWTEAGWINLPERVGAKIAKLIGAADDEVIATDSTSVNIFKLLAAAVRLRPQRRVILVEAGSFPTDVYMAEGLASLSPGMEVRLAEPRAEAIGEDIAVVLLGHADYKTAELRDMAALTAAAHGKGALIIWDLSHSAGALPIALGAADFAVGCGYKYLNGGPGAPAWLHVSRRWHEAFSQPLSGWMGHAAAFDFEPHYRPAKGLRRALSGTPSVIALSVLDAALDLLLEADMERVRASAQSQMDLFDGLLAARCPEAGLTLVTPRDHHRRGSHLAYRHPEGYALTQALRERLVIPDFRAPDIIRFGFTPLTLTHVDVWDAVDRLAAVWREGSFRDPRHKRRAAVT